MRWSILLAGLLWFGTGVAADEAEEASAKLYEYFEAFSAKESERIATRIYGTPVHIGGTAHRVLENPDAAIANLTRLYKQIEAQGWVESRIDNLQVCVLSENLVLVDTRYSRLKADGEAIPPAIRTTLYVVQRVDDDWRIVAFYGHDNDRRLNCS